MGFVVEGNRGHLLAALYPLPSLLCTSRRALSFSGTDDAFLELVIRVFFDFRLFTAVLSVFE